MPVRDRLKRAYYKILLCLNRTRDRAQPGDPKVTLQMADAHVQRQEWSAAIGLIQRVLQTAPNHADAYRLLAQAAQGQGDFAAAMTAINRSIAIDPTSPWTYHVLGQLHAAQREWDAAIAALQQAVTLDDQISWIQFNLGEALVKHGQWQTAQPVLQQAIRLNPLFPWAYYSLAEAQLALGEWEAAKQSYHKAQVRGPDLADLRGNAAYVEHLQAQTAQLQDYIQRCQIADRQAPRRRPRVLLITPGPPYPPKSGAALRMFYEMQALNAQTDLVVASLLYNKHSYPLKADIERYAQLAVLVDPSDSPPPPPNQPHIVHRYQSQYFGQLLDQLSQVDFDIVVTDFVYMGQYRHHFPHAFHVLSEHNIESQLLRRTAIVAQTAGSTAQSVEATSQEADRLAAFENQLWPQFPLRLVVSEQDRQQLRQRCAIGTTQVVTNGAETRKIPLLPDNPVPRVLLIGTLNYFPNIDGAQFCVQEILPHVWQQNPLVEFWIAGADPAPEVLALSAFDSRIKVIANPEEMLDVARQCSLAIVPLRIGSGTRIKILQSLAMGLPTVTTSLGCEGLAVVDDQHLLIRDQPIEFATAIVGLIADPQWRDRLRQAGRRLVEAQYDWEQIFEQAVQLILDTYADHVRSGIIGDESTATTPPGCDQ